MLAASHMALWLKCNLCDVDCVSEPRHNMTWTTTWLHTLLMHFTAVRWKGVVSHFAVRMDFADIIAGITVEMMSQCTAATYATICFNEDPCSHITSRIGTTSAGHQAIPDSGTSVNMTDTSGCREHSQCSHRLHLPSHCVAPVATTCISWVTGALRSHSQKIKKGPKMKKGKKQDSRLHQGTD